MQRRGLCLVLAAPSGAGKSTILAAMRRECPELGTSVSVTTRAPRGQEVDGRDYHFIQARDFQRMIGEGALLEHAFVFGRGYGTPRAPLLAQLERGQDVVLDIDWQGWRQLRQALPGDCVGVFILPPSLNVLQARLSGRGSDAPAEIARRMQAARAEISHWDEFDHLLLNESVEDCVASLLAILKAAQTTPRRALGLAELARGMAEG